MEINDNLVKIIKMAIEDKILMAVFLTLFIDLVLGRNYCIKTYARYKGIKLEEHWLK